MMKQSYSTFLEQTPSRLKVASIPGTLDTFPLRKQLSPERFQATNGILQQWGRGMPHTGSAQKNSIGWSYRTASNLIQT